VNGVALPGKWIGPCGVSVGANPDHIVEWNKCCAGIKRLEACDQVPCIIGGLTQCTNVDECLGIGRTPKVYACNGKGLVLADGSCDCTKDEKTGTGYTYDLSVYSTKGCFAKTQCSLAKVSGTPCNSKPACSNLENWTDLPDIAYIRQQAEILAAREGLPLTKQSIVERLVGKELEHVVLETYAEKALRTQSIKRAVLSDICVYPNDNSSAPFGMQPYVGKEEFIGPYMKALRAPFYLNDLLSTTTSSLFDGFWQSTYSSASFAPTSSPTIQPTPFISLSPTLSVPTAAPVPPSRFDIPEFEYVVMAEFSQSVYLDVIRMHMLLGSETTIAFFGNSTTVPVCQEITVPANSIYTWVDLFCLVQFEPERFDLNYPVEWSVNCKANQTSLQCEEWMQTTCLTISGGEVQLPNSLQPFPGCDQSFRCCVSTSAAFLSTTKLIILASSAISIDELGLFGHADSVQPLPPGLVATFQSKYNQSVVCVDEKVFFDPRFGIGGTLMPFKGYIQASNVERSGVCEYDGGVLATNVGEVLANQPYATSLGEVCFANLTISAPGCFVNARDTKEVSKPLNLEHIIQGSCSKYGCYQFEVATGLSYHSDPTDGVQWQTSWGVNQVAWSTFFTAVMDQVNTQYNKAGFRNFKVAPTAVPTSCSGITNFDDFFVQSPIPEAVLVDTIIIPPIIPDTSSTILWTDSNTCTFTMSSQPNCGNWKGNYAGFGFGEDLHDGFTKKFVLSTRTYESMLNGVNLLVLGENTNVKTTCSNSNLNCKFEGVWRSFEIHGDCDIEVGFINPSAGFANQASVFSPGGHSAANHAYCYDVPKIHDKFTAYTGCYPEIYKNNFGGEYLAAESSFDYTSVGDNFMYGITYARTCNANGFSGCVTTNNFTGTGGINTARFIPRFSSVKLKIEPMDERNSAFFGTDSFTMGYIEYPFMCIALKVTRLAKVTSGSVIIDTTVSVLIGGENAYYASATSGSTFFKLVSGNVVLPFTKCDVASGRPVIPCVQCQIKTPSKFEWNQEFMTSEFFFVGEVDAISQTGAGQTTPIPDIYTDYVNTVGTAFTRIKIDTLVLQRPYGRLLSFFTPAVYKSKFVLEYCLKVIQVSDPSYTYQFVKARCDENLYPVCIRDTFKYTVQIGRQCDRCGDSARILPIDPGSTAFTRYPLAKRENDPFGHMLLDAYLDGSLSVEIAKSEDVPWDDIYDHLTSAQFILAFPEARDFLIRGISTRPGFSSRGEVEDPVSWLDFAFARWFPVTCGEVKNRETGVSTRRCAISKEYCIQDFEAPPMSLASMPTLLFGMQTGQDPTTVSECGTKIYPNSFHVFDALGGPQPSTPNLLVLGNDPLVLRVQMTNSTWTNTGKPVRASLDVPFVLYGSIQSSVSVGFFRLWIGTLSFSFDTPLLKEFVGEWLPLTTTTFNIPHTPSSEYFSVFGFDFRNAQIGSQITLNPVLVTTLKSIAVCQARNSTQYLELPSSVESMAPNNRCVFSDADVLNEGDVVGACSCGANSPTAGPTCEWPATISENGKQVCNGFGDDGGMARTRSFSTTKLLSNLGVFLDENEFQCKCINPGLMVRTIMRPASAFDYSYYIRNDKLPNVPDFARVTEIPTDIPIPVTMELVPAVCNAASSVLPSWNTARELQALMTLISSGTFATDLVVRDSGLVWDRRNELFSNYNQTVIPIVPCVGDADLCIAMNWNNLAFGRYGQATDGLANTVLFYTALNITLAERVDDIVVEMFVAREEILTASFGNNKCKLVSQPVALLNKYECLFPNITHLFISRTIIDHIELKEVRIFKYLDNGRIPGYFN